MKINLAGTALVAVFVLGATASASAQMATDIATTRAQHQAARQSIIGAAMRLTEDESLAFWPAYRDYRVDMARLGDRLVKVIPEFVASDATLNDEQATRLLDEYLDIKAKDAAIKKKHAAAMRKLLPPAKVARFFQLENKLDAIDLYDLSQQIPLTP